jgi:hypothetical protein
MAAKSGQQTRNERSPATEQVAFDPAWAPNISGTGIAHGGLAIATSGEIVVPRPASGELCFLNREGQLLRSLATGAREAHGLAIAPLGAREVIWIADPGFTVIVNGSELEADRSAHGRVFAVHADDGSIAAQLPLPPHPAYNDTLYRPTSVAIIDIDGRQEIWVADGYGASLVHVFGFDGSHRRALDGESGAGRFDCPHAVHLDQRHSPRIYVADRGNHRIQVFDLDGRYERSVGEEFLTSPGGFAQIGTRLVVAELQARLVILNGNDQLETVLGEDRDAASRPGWPNRLDADGVLERPEPFASGRFNSPHAVVTDGRGSLYVSEYVLGGRFSRVEVSRSLRAL